VGGVKPNRKIDLQEATRKLASECCRAVNDWLCECVRKHHQEAAAFMRAGFPYDASAKLSTAGFYYRQLPDGSYEFCRGKEALSRFKLEIEFSKQPFTKTP